MLKPYVERPIAVLDLTLKGKFKVFPISSPYISEMSRFRAYTTIKP